MYTAGIYNATPPSLSDGQQTQIQLDAAGNLKAAIAAGSALIGKVGTVDALGVAYPADSTLPSEIVGSTAAGAVDSGKPVKIGGKYLATPSATGNDDGDRVDALFDSFGNARVFLTGIATTLGDGILNSGLAAVVSNSTQTGGRPLVVAPVKFNGTTWDKDRKPNAVSRIASSAGSVNATNAKNAAGDVFKAIGVNAKAAVVYLKLYNKASAPTVGTDTPFMTVALPASAPFNIDFGGLYMGTGISYGFTTDAADAGTTAILAADILGFNLSYA